MFGAVRTDDVTYFTSFAFTREWVGYAFESRAVTDCTIAASTEALASKKPDCSNLVLRTGNGSKYVSLQFDKL